MKKRKIFLLPSIWTLLSLFIFTSAYALTPLETYCNQSDGHVVTMRAVYDTPQGYINGVSHEFCTFEIPIGKDSHNHAVIGLKALGSASPSIAATFMKELPAFDISALEQVYSNPAANLCHQLKGTEIGFHASGSGFTEDLGQADICVFGDGSMVSAWTLVYSAMSDYPDLGFDYVKKRIHAKPLPIKIPELPPYS